jgi:DNA polymerase phi
LIRFKKVVRAFVISKPPVAVAFLPLLNKKTWVLMSTILPLFWNLSSASKKERVDASVKLVSSLEQFQAQFVPIPKEPASDSSEAQAEVDEDEDEKNDFKKKQDGLDELNAQDVSYSIRRLVRGLASPRESSRLGFSVALTEVRD